MGEYRKKYDEDFKKNAVKLSYASPKTVREIADDLGVHENLLTGGEGLQNTVTRRSMPRLKKKTGISKGSLPRPKWSVTC